jgi:hypothetical protein
VCCNFSSLDPRLAHTFIAATGLGRVFAGDQCAAEGVYAADAGAGDDGISLTISHRQCVCVGAASVVDMIRVAISDVESLANMFAVVDRTFLVAIEKVDCIFSIPLRWKSHAV